MTKHTNKEVQKALVEAFDVVTGIKQDILSFRLEQAKRETDIIKMQLEHKIETMQLETQALLDDLKASIEETISTSGSYTALLQGLDSILKKIEKKIATGY